LTSGWLVPVFSRSRARASRNSERKDTPPLRNASSSCGTIGNETPLRTSIAIATRSGCTNLAAIAYGTPQPIVDKLRAELNAVLAMPDVKERLVSGGAGEPYVTTPEEFAAVMRADYERYGAVIKSIGFKVD